MSYDRILSAVEDLDAALSLLERVSHLSRLPSRRALDEAAAQMAEAARLIQAANSGMDLRASA
ncbi:hypothetical protein HHL28_04020 [Aerophototrophica crusticola]|uniref:Uncharacterized protein n=1 Tax=Aerophototrophica crusticola TaxID=1709002 RepID=A0A858R4Q9_9PROT|nr:hypothetical protein HHL28_04020 [Rhodospirillaceae bacterium B3]